MAKYFSDMCKISVVVPVYKTEKTVEKCVKSILAQSFTDFELLLINDGSPDNCGTICENLAKEDNRIKYFYKENGGLSSARNFGLEKASGEYITFADSDDYIEPNTFEEMYNEIVSSKADVILCGYYIESGKTVIENKHKKVILNADNYNDYMVELKSKNLIDSVWNKLYNLQFLRNSGVVMPVGENYEDTAFNLELLSKKPIISVLDKCFYHYVQNMGSITKKYDSKKLPIIKKRAIQLKNATSGIEEYCDFYYVKSVFSCLIDMFTCCKKQEIMKTIKEEINDGYFISAANNAKFGGKLNGLIISTAKSQNENRVYKFCFGCYLLKYKMRKLFMKVR